MIYENKRTTGPLLPLAWTALGLLALLGQAACTVGPDYLRPAAPVPPMFKEAVQADRADGSGPWKVAAPAEGLPRGAWWEMYGDPQLNGLEEQVLVSNQNVLAAEARFRQARALVQVARAGFFPTLTVGASASRSRVSENLGQSRFSSGVQTDYALPAEATWEPDLWGRVRRSVEANTASAQASAADLELIRLSARIELAQAYFQLRANDAAQGLLNATVGSYQESLQLTRNRYSGGVASMADVVQAETQLKTVQAQTVDLRVQRAQLEHAIALLVGKSPAELTIPPSPLDWGPEAGPPAIPAALPSELLERRPDIAGAERRMAALNAQIGVVEAAYYPNVVLSVSGGFEASTLSRLLSWPSRFWSIGPSISETIFEGGLRRAQTEQVRAAYDEGVANYRQTVLAGFQDVEDNLAALRHLEEEARILEEAVASSRQSVAITMNQYKAGIVGYLNVITAQTAELTVERSALSVLGSRMIAHVLLVRALGGGWHAGGLDNALAEGADKAAETRQ